MEENKQNLIENLSQKLFNKPSKDIKYLMVTNYIHISLLEENLNRTGLYNWIQTFNGKISKPGDVKDYNDFDIIHINMSKQDRYLPSHIRKQLKEDSRTVIVSNNDYTSELWEGVMVHPSSQCKYYEDSDLLFGTEYFQSGALSVVTGQRIYAIPHPTNVTRLKGLKKLDKKPYIAIVWRRYDKFAYVPALVAMDFGLQTVLVGYDRNHDPNWYITESMYDQVVNHTNYDNYLKILQEAKIVYNPYTLHSYDRLAVDAASLGCAVVGTDRTSAMKLCYPQTICDPYDIKATKDLIARLLNDQEFYDSVISVALDKVEHYNQENSKLRLLQSLRDNINYQNEMNGVE